MCSTQITASRFNGLRRLKSEQILLKTGKKSALDAYLM